MVASQKRSPPSVPRFVMMAGSILLNIIGSLRPVVLLTLAQLLGSFALCGWAGRYLAALTVCCAAASRPAPPAHRRAHGTRPRLARPCSRRTSAQRKRSRGHVRKLKRTGRRARKTCCSDVNQRADWLTAQPKM
jgi:hypothetical protein